MADIDFEDERATPMTPDEERAMIRAGTHPMQQPVSDDVAAATQRKAEARQWAQQYTPDALKQAAMEGQARIDAQKRAQSEAAVSRVREMRQPDQAGMVMGGADAAQLQREEIARALAAKRVVSSPNPMYGPTKQYAGIMRSSYENEARGAQMQIAAERLQQQALAEQQVTNVVEFEAEVKANRAKEAIRAEEVQRGIDVQQRAATAHQKAVDMLASAPDIDPDRYWANKNTGVKIAAVLGAAFLGASGRDPFQHIMGMAQMELDAQKANLAKLESVVSGRQSSFNNQAVILSGLREHFSDQRSADLAFENVFLEMMKQRMAAMQAQTGVPIQNAQALQAVAQIDQKHAANLLQIEQLERVGNPKYFTRSVPVYSPGELAAMESRSKYLGKVAEGGVGTAYDIAKEQAKEKTGKPEQEVYGERGLYARTEKFGKMVEPVVAFKRTLSELRQGLESGAWARGMTAGRLRDVAIDALGRMQSQGAITDDEVESFESMLSGWTAEGNLEKLRMVEQLADAKIENARRGLGDDAAAEYFRIPQESLPQLGVTEVMSGSSKRAKEGAGYTVEPQ